MTTGQKPIRLSCLSVPSNATAPYGRSFRGVCWVGGIYALGQVIQPLAGQNTALSLAVSLLADAKLTVAITLAVRRHRALVERHLRHQKTEYLQNRVKELELKLDTEAEQFGAHAGRKDEPEGQEELMMHYNAFFASWTLLILLVLFVRGPWRCPDFAPGKVMQALSGRTVLTHDCTSLGGNSGSPLVRLSDGKVVGLHFSGRYGVENSAVGVQTRCASCCDAGTAARTFVLPPIQAGGAEAADGCTGPNNCRAGRLRPDFLGSGRLSAPWPVLPAEVQATLARPSDELARAAVRAAVHALRCAVLRGAPATADDRGEHRRRAQRCASSGKPTSGSPTAAFPRTCSCARPTSPTRRSTAATWYGGEDPNWDPDAAAGVPSALAEQANLRHLPLHQRRAAARDLNQGTQLWLGLENYLLDSARTTDFRACVFTGPVLRDDDPAIGPGVLAPREFWKLVVMAAAGGDTLHATAYLLSQGDLIRELLESRDRTEANEGFVLGAYRTFQIAVRDLAEATGLRHVGVRGRRPAAARRHRRGRRRDVPVFVPLESLDQVVA